MDTRLRERMVRSQVRCWSVLDDRVLGVMRDLPREDFVPEQYRSLAYADLALPLPGGQEMMTPSVEGRILQALDLKPGDRVAEVGAGSGWLAACLARMAGEVHSVEISPELHAAATERLSTHGNVKTWCADAFEWEPEGVYDAVVLTGSMPRYEERFEKWLDDGGRLFCIVGRQPIMEALLIRPGQPRQEESLFETVATALTNAPQPDSFRL